MRKRDHDKILRNYQSEIDCLRAEVKRLKAEIEHLQNAASNEVGLRRTSPACAGRRAGRPGCVFVRIAGISNKFLPKPLTKAKRMGYNGGKIETGDNEMANNDPYEIPFEMAESVKGHIGQTATVNGMAIKVLRWEGQNYIIDQGNGEKSVPVMYFLDQARRHKAVWS